MVPSKLKGLYKGSHSSSGEGQSLCPPLPQHHRLLCLLQLHPAPHSSIGIPVTPSCPGQLAQSWPKHQQREELMDHLWSHWMCSQQPHTHPLITCGFRVAHLAPGLVPGRRSSLTGSWVGYNPPSSMWALQENAPLFCCRINHSLLETTIFTFPVVDSSGSLCHTHGERGQNQERRRAGLTCLAPTS